MDSDSDESDLAEEKWYCVRSRPKQEALAARFLRREAGLEVFCPMIRFRRSRRQHAMWVTEAMFPNYLFVRFDYRRNHRHVAASRGVVNIVGFGGIPSVVPDPVIAELSARVSESETIVIERPVRVGDEVKLLDGPLGGIQALVTRVIPARKRIAVLLDLLGETREVEIDADRILRAASHPLVD